MTVRELAQMANFGGDIKYGRKLKGDRIKAEDLLSRLTDKAQDKAQGNKKLQNLIDGAKFLSTFIPGVGPAISAAISVADLIGDTTRDSSFKLSKQQKDSISGIAYEDIIKQNVGALESQVEQAVKGQAKSSLLSNLLNIGLSLGGLPGVKGGDAAVNVGTDAATKTVEKTATDVAAETVKQVPTKTIPGVDPYFPMNQNVVDVPSLITDASKRGKEIAGDVFSGASDKIGAALDSETGQFLSGKGTEKSFIDEVGDKAWFQALEDTVPGMKTAVGLSKKEIGKTGATYGSLYGPTSSILTRLLTTYGDATSPAMPKYQRKSIRRRIV